MQWPQVIAQAMLSKAVGTKTTPKGPRQRENQKQISQKSSGDGKKKEEKEEEEEKVGTRIRLGLKPNRRIKYHLWLNIFNVSPCKNVYKTEILQVFSGGKTKIIW